MLQLMMLLMISADLTGQAPSATAHKSLPEYTTPEAYEVYEAVLPMEWAWRVADAKSLVIQCETKPGRMCLTPEKESEALLGPAISDYAAQNQGTWTLQECLHITKPYELVNSAGLDSLVASESNGWKAFYQKHPDSGGWIAFSAVGFNADKTVAVVYVSHYCGSLCAGGKFYVLQKKEGTWGPLEWRGASCQWMS